MNVVTQKREQPVFRDTFSILTLQMVLKLFRQWCRFTMTLSLMKTSRDVDMLTIVKIIHLMSSQLDCVCLSEIKKKTEQKLKCKSRQITQTLFCEK